jgi:hypothetical protein
MKSRKAAIYIVFISISGFVSCAKDNTNLEKITIPNGDFESWNLNSLQNWETNSCPLCLPAYDTYIVKQESDSYHGQYAAKFIYNNVYTAWAQNKFSIPNHPSNMTSYVKCDLYGADTVSIKINLFYNRVIVDSGQWLGTSSITSYNKINIAITQNSSKVDTALIRIEGGHTFDYPDKSTEFWVDYLTLQ